MGKGLLLFVHNSANLIGQFPMQSKSQVAQVACCSSCETNQLSIIIPPFDSLVKLITMNMRHRMNKEEAIFTGHGSRLVGDS
jgi:hypothetical protein